MVRGTISTNLELIWEMSVKTVLSAAAVIVVLPLATPGAQAQF